ncbi:MerR family transcriptional regulator [Leuconostoc gasicomitatum]|uniref:MerR family transcriptional regulator n=1 Tax=Leuconostoc gasicomitatum TaxID=115778 RepID=A0A9Q3XUK6_9LACO|nr:MerR family transcriptional regulator [Leuconostoc gasicomitatum]MBZ5962926.1 MerR family transcriptional regulator [Leuconostoc gasicomitatum]
MQTYSISQVAKIFKITKYTIRHYVDEHLLVPLKDEVNGYYIFSEEDLYRLYQVITFRKIGYSISSIKKILVQNDLVNVFEIAENKIQNKIDELVEIKSSIQEVIQAQETTNLNEIYFCEKSERFFKRIPKNLLEEGQVNLFTASNSGFVQLENINYLIDKEGNYVTYSRARFDDYDCKIYPGTHACNDILVADEQSLEKQIEVFKNDHLIKSSLASGSGIMLCYENILKSLAYSEETVFTIEVKL